jgi:hypothetical protein
MSWVSPDLSFGKAFAQAYMNDENAGKTETGERTV